MNTKEKLKADIHSCLDILTLLQTKYNLTNSEVKEKINSTQRNISNRLGQTLNDLDEVDKFLLHNLTTIKNISNMKKQIIQDLCSCLKYIIPLIGGKINLEQFQNDNLITLKKLLNLWDISNEIRPGHFKQYFFLRKNPKI